MEKKGDLKTFIKTKSYIVNVICLSIFWATGSYSYYLTTFYIKYVPANIYILSILFGISDLASNTTFKILVSKFDVTKLIRITYMILAILALVFFLML